MVLIFIEEQCNIDHQAMEIFDGASWQEEMNAVTNNGKRSRNIINYSNLFATFKIVYFRFIKRIQCSTRTVVKYWKGSFLMVTAF